MEQYLYICRCTCSSPGRRTRVKSHACAQRNGLRTPSRLPADVSLSRLEVLSPPHCVRFKLMLVTAEQVIIVFAFGLWNPDNLTRIAVRMRFLC